jgi:hypothetical protein
MVTTASRLRWAHVGQVGQGHPWPKAQVGDVADDLFHLHVVAGAHVEQVRAVARPDAHVAGGRADDGHPLLGDVAQARFRPSAAGVADQRQHPVLLDQPLCVGQHRVALAAVVGRHELERPPRHPTLGIGAGKRGFDAGADVGRVRRLAAAEAATLADSQRLRLRRGGKHQPRGRSPEQPHHGEGQRAGGA